jgi:hypothetical protein
MAVVSPTVVPGTQATGWQPVGLLADPGDGLNSAAVETIPPTVRRQAKALPPRKIRIPPCLAARIVLFFLSVFVDEPVRC